MRTTLLEVVGLALLAAAGVLVGALAGVLVAAAAGAAVVGAECLFVSHRLVKAKANGARR